MLYLTGSGLNPKTIPILTAHPMVGVLSTPVSIGASYVEPFENWGADNGCFSQGARFNLTAYLAWLRKMSPLVARCRTNRQHRLCFAVNCPCRCHSEVK